MSMLPVLDDRHGLPVFAGDVESQTFASREPAEALAGMAQTADSELGGTYFTKTLVGELGLETICESCPLPEPLRVLDPAHGHVHDPGGDLHPSLRLLRRQAGKARGRGGRRAGAPGRGLPPARPPARRDHLGDARRPRPTAAPSTSAAASWRFASAPARRSRSSRPISTAGPTASIVLSARPEVFNHNLETVARLQQHVRRKSQYDVSLEVLGHVKTASPTTRTKSGLMLGLGETTEELLETLADLRSIGCDLLTLGQYLQPSPRHLPVVRYLPPARVRRAGEDRPLARLRRGRQRAVRPLELSRRRDGGVKTIAAGQRAGIWWTLRKRMGCDNSLTRPVLAVDDPGFRRASSWPGS